MMLKRTDPLATSPTRLSVPPFRMTALSLLVAEKVLLWAIATLRHAHALPRRQVAG